MLTIGLTGSFGTGKTTVLKLFGESGAQTFNSDNYVHITLKNPDIVKKISDALGDDVLKDKSSPAVINKKRVADIIFTEPRKRKAVEKIIHPRVLNEIKLTKSRIMKADPSAIIIFEVPLLFESGYENIFDKTIFVYCSRDTAIERLIKKGFSREEVLKRIRAQMPVTRKKKLADFVIDNNNGIDSTRLQVDRLLKKIRGG